MGSTSTRRSSAAELLLGMEQVLNAGGYRKTKRFGSTARNLALVIDGSYDGRKRFPFSKFKQVIAAANNNLQPLTIDISGYQIMMMMHAVILETFSAVKVQDVTGVLRMLKSYAKLRKFEVRGGTDFG
ncbi:hypothetical protein BGZ81_009348 [Podila clonocystis]|nr:hypothetical protein BGZ81_009348 [Podila clonocystis]